MPGMVMEKSRYNLNIKMVSTTVTSKADLEWRIKHFNKRNMG